MLTFRQAGLMACMSLTAMALYAEESSDLDDTAQKIFGEEVIGLLGQLPENERKITRALIEGVGSLNSAGANQSFQFELMVHAGRDSPVAAQYRMIVDHRRELSMSVSSTAGGVTSSVRTNGGEWVLQEDGVWRGRNLDSWGIWIDQDHLINFFNPSQEPKNGSIALVLAPGGYLKGYFMEDQLRPAYMAAIDSLAYDRTSGSKFRIALRSPNDTIRYGSFLGGLSLRTNDDALINVRAIQTSEKMTRLKPMKFEDLGMLIGGQRLLDGQSGTRIAEITSEAQSSAYDRLWKTISTTPEAEVSLTLPRGQPSEVDVDLGNEKATAAFLGKLAILRVSLLSPVNNGINREGNLSDRTSQMRDWLGEVVRQSVHETIELQNGATWVDDPFMRWREFETRVSPVVAQSLGNMLLDLVKHAESDDIRADALHLLAITGPPAGLGDPVRFLDAYLPDPVARDVIRGYWNLDVTDEGVQRLIASLKNGSNKMADAVITSLLAMGKADNIPAAQLRDWMDRHLLQGSYVSKSICATQFSRHAGNVEWLLTQQQHWKSSRKESMVLKEVLLERAKATLELERFDFLTREQCQRILDLWKAKNQ